MKYLKKFENVNTNPEIGDYVSLKKDSLCIEEYRYFLDNPCKVISVDNRHIKNKVIKLQCGIDIIIWNIKDIEYYSKNKEDVETYIQTKKYNI